jgi:class 3 adenylate cyclase
VKIVFEDGTESRGTVTDGGKLTVAIGGAATARARKSFSLSFGDNSKNHIICEKPGEDAVVTLGDQPQRDEHGTIAKRLFKLPTKWSMLESDWTVTDHDARYDADKARIDQLLHNILPAPIVTELKANDRVEPRHHGDVTVLFTDFVGFSSVAEQVTAEELVADLDSCFTLFDTIAARRGLERLKTIGDSYMAAAGVPVARRTHAADAVLAGLDIARAIADRSAARRAGGRPGWDVRVGIHTGPLVAGVVGQTRFAYDVWGDTVNLASRMESSGAPGRVNVSEGTAGRVAELFVLEPRGRVAAKGKGLVEMFFVVGIRPELSVDGAGIEPSAAFWERARA